MSYFFVPGSFPYIVSSVDMIIDSMNNGPLRVSPAFAPAIAAFWGSLAPARPLATIIPPNQKIRVQRIPNPINFIMDLSPGAEVDDLIF